MKAPICGDFRDFIDAPGRAGSYRRSRSRPVKEPDMQKPIVITFAVVAAIVVAAFSTLAVLSAFAGQQHGLDCARVAVTKDAATLCGR
jgi:hypothetical protein